MSVLFTHENCKIIVVTKDLTIVCDAEKLNIERNCEYDVDKLHSYPYKKYIQTGAETFLSGTLVSMVAYNKILSHGEILNLLQPKEPSWFKRTFKLFFG